MAHLILQDPITHLCSCKAINISVGRLLKMCITQIRIIILHMDCQTKDTIKKHITINKITWRIRLEIILEICFRKRDTDL